MHSMMYLEDDWIEESRVKLRKSIPVLGDLSLTTLVRKKANSGSCNQKTISPRELVQIPNSHEEIFTQQHTNHIHKEPYIKYDRNLGGRGGWWIAVSISNSDILLSSNNDVILQSEGGGGKKAQRIAIILIVWLLT